MNKKNKKLLVPKLRFPEFYESGEWTLTNFVNIADFYKGKNISKADIDQQGKTLCIRYGELYTHFNEIINTIHSRTNIPTSELFLSIKNDVIIPSSGETKEDIATASCVMLDGVALGGDINVIRCNENGIFLSYYLNGSKSKAIAKIAQGDSVVHLYLRQIMSLKIELPPKKSEQQKIADCLSSLDELITAEAHKLEAYKAHRKGLMQKLFPAEGETVSEWRFPEFRESGEWDKIKLIDTANKKKKWSFIGGPFGSNLKSCDYTNTGVRIIQLQNIGDAKFIDTYKIFTSEKKADELLSCNIYPGEIILSKMGAPVGRACLIPNNHSRYVMCSDGIRLVVDENHYSKYFIYSLINSDQFRSKIENNSTGSTRKRIGLDVLKNLPMTVPHKPEQQKIADCLSSLDELITAHAKKIDTLKAHKKGLMQELFPSTDEVGE
jgi:type I restriction enzyme S subunit